MYNEVKGDEKMKKIMIVEDDEVVRKELEELLKNAGYDTIGIIDFSNVVESFNQINPDLLLLDINIPYLNGELVLKEIRKTSDVPIIMVTSRVNDVDEVLSMSYGADDYITKPYHPTILLLRIQNLFKRYDKKKVSSLMYRDIKVDQTKGILKKGEEECELTKNEMIIFMYLFNHQEQLVSRDELMTNLWDNKEYINDNALTVNISRLRNKLALLGYQDVIKTRKGYGNILV